MITFPGDYPTFPSAQFSGATSIGGAEKYNLVDASKISVTNVEAETVKASWVYAGYINAGQINAGYLSADRIEAGTITSGKISVSNLAAINADMGTITAGSMSVARLTSGTMYVGGTNEPSAIIIRETTKTGNARLAFEHNSRIWEDSAADMGLNAIGGDFTIYTDSTQRAYFGASNVNFYPATVYLHKIDFAFDGATEGNIDNVDIIRGKTDIRFQIQSGDDFKFLDGDGHENAYIHGDTGRFESSNSYVTLAGVDKTAIVLTSRGYKTLYCVESPEVWFFDFCKNKEEVDPLFLEATEGETKFIKCEDETYQVWRRRKGHAHKRFELKSAEEFEKNESFYQQAKLHRKEVASNG